MFFDQVKYCLTTWRDGVCKSVSKAVRHPVAPLVRGAFIQALRIVGDRRRQTLPEMVAQEIEEKGLVIVLQAISRFAEKESNVAVEVSNTSLVDILKGLNEATEETVRH